MLDGCSYHNNKSYYHPLKEILKSYMESCEYGVIYLAYVVPTTIKLNDDLKNRIIHVNERGSNGETITKYINYIEILHWITCCYGEIYDGKMKLFNGEEIDVWSHCSKHPSPYCKCVRISTNDILDNILTNIESPETIEIVKNYEIKLICETPLLWMHYIDFYEKCLFDFWKPNQEPEYKNNKKRYLISDK